MSRGERIGLWAAVGVLGLWLLVLTVMMAGELAAVNRVLRGEIGGDSPPVVAGEPTPWWGGAGRGEEAPSGRASVRAHPSVSAEVGLAGVRILSDTLEMTVTVRSSGAGDLLYEPPVVVDDGGRVYPVTGESLEAARLAFLDLVTRGQAQAGLSFAGEPAAAWLVLVLNPNQQPSDLLAPRLEVPVPMPPTPMPDG
ncbi:MAG TPA: hypothetical protein ENI39_07060 [Anaerolineae bacterium]|nr:hypothetical protein [Anaerolineae bacterium]